MRTKLSKEDLKIIINDDLYNELKYLLCATASWKIAKENPQELPAHFIVYTMDSAFLHARSLFEFFTYVPSGRKTYLITWKDFQLNSGLESPLYKIWMVPLHHHIMHLEDRQDVNNEIDGIHLKNMVIAFSVEVVRLWIVFSSQLDHGLEAQMDRRLEKSVSEAEMIFPEIRNLLNIPSKQ